MHASDATVSLLMLCHTTNMDVNCTAKHASQHGMQEPAEPLRKWLVNSSLALY